MRVLELFCGIGGFAAAAAGTNLAVEAAVDQSPAALEVYRLNFPAHQALQRNLEHLRPEDLARSDAAFWWMSPPCQPYTVRGSGKDVSDPRASSLLHILAVLAGLPDRRLPRHIALENVEGFSRSEMRRRLIGLLADRGFHLLEMTLCPTNLGIPMRRPRYYLAASRKALRAPVTVVDPAVKSLRSYLERRPARDAGDDLEVRNEVLSRFGQGFRILDAGDDGAYTTCFTAGYGRSHMFSGSYLREGERVRRFSPAEIARLLGFPERFSFPLGMTVRKRWQLLGNSLSVAAVRKILEAFPDVRWNQGIAGRGR